MARLMSIRTAPVSRPIGLALQGGGAHGAFTWGVLDRLLQEESISVEAISGTSSGALNGLALAQGWMEGGREGARRCLADLWRRIASHSHAAAWIFGSRILAKQADARNLHRYFTPRQINPLNFNPVRQIAEAMFDFERLRVQSPFPLYMAATRVRDGALMMFGPGQLSVDALLASTCLPQIFAPVTVESEVYWDGGWAGNPALEPLLQGAAETILAVLVRPLDHQDIPRTPEKIATRMAELGFSAAFQRELRSLLLIRKTLGQAQTLSSQGQHIRNLSIQLLAPDSALDSYRSITALATPMAFLAALRDHGQERTQSWLLDPESHTASTDLPVPEYPSR